MPGIPNNPAARLLEILLAVRKQPVDTKVRQVWAQAFGLEANDTAGVLNAVADMIYLVRDAKAAVRSLQDINHKLYLKPFGPVETGLAIANLEAKWDTFKRYIDDPTVARLELVAETLGRMLPEGVPDVDELKKLEAEIGEVYDSVIQSDLPQQLKSAILESLESIRTAIRAFRIRGIKGLLDALARSAGAVVIHGSVFRSHRDDPLVESFFGVLGRLNQVVAAASNVHTFLGPAVQQLLLPGS